jgi:hypothetical protein
MCEKVRIILMSIYFCVHFLVLLASFRFFFKIMNFLATLSMHVCSVACYR